MEYPFRYSTFSLSVSSYYVSVPENVRGAQALVGYIYPLIFIPAMALMYVDINTLPIAIRHDILRHPLQPPDYSFASGIMGDYTTVAFGIVYVAVFTVVIMYIASRLFATEKILTAKLMFKKAKKTPTE